MALKHSDLHVLRATLAVLDPGSWLDAAELAPDAGVRKELIGVSAAIEGLGFSSDAYAMLRKIQTDHLALRSVWPDAPRMAVEEQLLHAIRLAIVQRIWRLAIKVPTFSPRFGVTHKAVVTRLLRLDVPATLEVLATVFPGRAGRRSRPRLSRAERASDRRRLRARASRGVRADRGDVRPGARDQRGGVAFGRGVRVGAVIQPLHKDGLGSPVMRSARRAPYRRLPALSR